MPFGMTGRSLLIPAGNEPSGCASIREGHIPRCLQRYKLDALLLAAGLLTHEYRTAQKTGNQEKVSCFFVLLCRAKG